MKGRRTALAREGEGIVDCTDIEREEKNLMREV